MGLDWFLLQGSICHFQWSDGSENLTEKIQRRSTKRTGSGRKAASAQRMSGALATAAMVEAYDGENTENFTCTVGGKVVCGRFCGASKLRDGDKVRMVVSGLENGALFAHAIERPSDELLWLPNQVYCGDHAAFRDALRSVQFASLFSWIAIALVFLFGNAISATAFTAAQTVGFLVLFALGIPLLVLFGTFFPSRPAKEFGEIGSRIFTVLEFPCPDNLSMNDVRLSVKKDENKVSDVYHYGPALSAHVQRISAKAA